MNEMKIVNIGILSLFQQFDCNVHCIPRYIYIYI